MKKSVKKGIENIIGQLDFFAEALEKEPIKSRPAKFNPKTGIWIEDKELSNETKFQPGVKFTYGLDKKNQILKITATEGEVGTSVAPKKKDGEIVGSIVHVRRAEVLEIFKGCNNLQFEIFDDCIVVKKNEDIEDNAQLKDNTSYVISKEDIEYYADPQCEEEIRRAVAKHVKNKPILQKVYDIVKEPLKFISLFSGIGTMDYAFELEGFEPVLAVEINEAASKTYKNNMKGPMYNGDVNDVDFEQYKGMVDVVIGGSPCQDFSNQNPNKVFDSPRNKLVYKFIDVVKKVGAKAFLLENVPQILTAGGKKYIQAIKNLLPDFRISVGVLNSDNYGSAQSRERAYIIGSKLGEEILHPEPTTKKQEDKKTVREAFEGLTEDMPNYNDWSKPTAITLKRMSFVPENGNYLDIPEELRTRGSFSNNYRRLGWENQSPTIVNLGKTIMMHPAFNRILSIREQARLFGIPDTWEFIGNMLEKQQQAANTVVVEVVNAIAKQIKNAFDVAYDKKLAARFNLAYV